MLHPVGTSGSKSKASTHPTSCWCTARCCWNSRRSLRICSQHYKGAIPKSTSENRTHRSLRYSSDNSADQMPQSRNSRSTSFNTGKFSQLQSSKCFAPSMPTGCAGCSEAKSSVSTCVRHGWVLGARGCSGRLCKRYNFLFNPPGEVECPLYLTSCGFRGNVRSTKVPAGG